MRKGFLVLAATAVLVAGCAANTVRPSGIGTVTEAEAASALRPYDAIHRAAEAAPAGTPGPFLITVQAAGSQGGADRPDASGAG